MLCMDWYDLAHVREDGVFFRSVQFYSLSIRWHSSQLHLCGSFLCFNRTPSSISVSIIHPQGKCSIPPENMSNPRPDGRTVLLAEK